MEDGITTNDKIAIELRNQTYEERMEMAAWFSSVADDCVTDKGDLDRNWFAETFQSWSDAQLEEQQSQ